MEARLYSGPSLKKPGLEELVGSRQCSTGAIRIRMAFLPAACAERALTRGALNSLGIGAFMFDDDRMGAVLVRTPAHVDVAFDDGKHEKVQIALVSVFGGTLSHVTLLSLG